MELKLFEVRDRGTCIPVAALKLGARNDKELWLIDRAGYGQSLIQQQEYILLFRLDCVGNFITYDPFAWKGSRTLHQAHLFLQEHFDELQSGEVIDVEYILRETTTPKTSDRIVENLETT